MPAMGTRLLHESAGTFRASEGGKWSAVLITPGKGTSGTYGEAMLEQYGSVAFPKGTKLWFGHPADGEPGNRDPRDHWGTLDEAATYVPGEGLTGKIRLLPHWKDVVESIGADASLSVYVMGEADEDGNITKLSEAVTNSVDMVSYPGRAGSGLKQKIEAARAATTDPAVTSAAVSKEESVDEKILAAVEGLTKAVEAQSTALTTFLAEQAKAGDAKAKAEADAKAEIQEKTDAIEAFAVASKAISEAKLLPSLEAPLVEAAKRGEDVTAGIESAKKVMTEASEAAKGNVSEGYIQEPTGNKVSFALKGGRR